MTNIRRLEIAGPDVVRLGQMEEAISDALSLTAAVSVLDYGVSAEADDNHAALTEAMEDAAARGLRLFIPAGTYFVRSTVRIPSNSYIFGAGPSSVIKMRGNVPRNLTLMRTGGRGDQRENIALESFTVDFNRDRWEITGGALEENMNQTCLSICNTKYARVKGVHAIDGYKHSIDVQAPSYQRGLGNAETYDSEPSEYVWLDSCYAIGAGDDNITTHQSTWIWITNCTSEFPSGARTSNNSNCFEIDDGSRNVFLSNCFARGGVRGLEIKGHSDSPAPYNVTVDGFQTVNNCVGVELRHLGHHGEDPDDPGDDGEPGGTSATAKNVNLSNITIVAPRRVSTDLDNVARRGLVIKAYRDVKISNIQITDGSEDLTGKDYDPTDHTGQAVVRIYLNARRVYISNLQINGFPNVTYGVYITSSFLGNLFIDGFSVFNGPETGYRATSPTSHMVLENFRVFGDHASTGVGVRMSTSSSYLGYGSVSGYNDPVLIASGANSLLTW